MSSETLNTAGAFSQAKDLKNRILFTILILIIYRLGTYVPLAGIDPLALKEIMASSQKGLLGMFNMFSEERYKNGHFCLRYNAIYFIFYYCTTFNRSFRLF